MVGHAVIVLGPIDPYIFLLDKEPVVYAAIRDRHIESNLSKVLRI